MTINETLSQIFYLIIVIFSVLIAWEFYKSRNGILRVLIISLFVAKVWFYGGAMIYHFLLDFNLIQKPDRIYVQLILSFPMVIVMIKLWGYIRLHNK